jgi:hypothetical protein
VGALVATPIAVYASHQFSDVPNTNPFHDDISWLADAEVTLGCGPNAYCPKDLVTREQMAAFMRRLAENQVVDAGTVDGLDSSELTGSGGGLTIEVVANSVDAFEGTPSTFADVQCPDGFTVIGGGAGIGTSIGNDVWIMNISKLVSAGAGTFVNDGWSSRFQTVDGGPPVGTYTFRVIAICADIG